MWFRVVLPDADPENEEMDRRMSLDRPHVIGEGTIER